MLYLHHIKSEIPFFGALRHATTVAEQPKLSTATVTPSRVLNPLSPHDALKHHFTSLKTSLIFLQPRVLERKFP